MSWIVPWLIVLLSPIVLIIILVFARLFINFAKGKRLKPRSGKLQRKRPIWKRLFIDFPKTFVDDMLNKDPDKFPDYGVHLICGEQGSGKTITLAYLLNKYKKEYPKSKVRTNFNYKKEDGEIKHWKDLVLVNNGIYGQIDVLDEMQNWFSSNQSKDFPIEMLQEITQQRKQIKVIYGTAQVFQRVAKPIREQVNFLYQPITIFGCLTIVKVTKPLMDENASVTKQRLLRYFFFVHDSEVRDSFDTYKKIEKLTEDGFTPRDYGTATIINMGNLKKTKV